MMRRRWDAQLFGWTKMNPEWVRTKLKLLRACWPRQLVSRGDVYYSGRSAPTIFLPFSLYTNESLLN